LINKKYKSFAAINKLQFNTVHPNSLKDDPVLKDYIKERKKQKRFKTGDDSSSKMQLLKLLVQQIFSGRKLNF
jgi:hypothetical protein